MVAGEAALRPCLLGIRLRRGRCRHGGHAHAKLRQIIVKRALRFSRGDRPAVGCHLHRLICVCVCVGKQRALRLRLVVAGEAALRPGLLGIRLRRGRCRHGGRFEARRSFLGLFRYIAFGGLRLFRRRLILRRFAARLQRLVEIFIHRAGNIRHRFCGDVRHERRAAERNRGRRFPRRLLSGHDLVKGTLRVLLSRGAFFVPDGVVRRRIVVVINARKLRLRFAHAPLLPVGPCPLGIRLIHLLFVRAAAVFHREFRHLHGHLPRFGRCLFRRCLRGGLDPILRQRAVLDAVDVLHQQRRIAACVRQGCLAQLADRFIEGVAVQPHLRAVDLAVFHKLAKARRRDLQLARVLLEHGVKRIHHLLILALDDLRVAEHALAVRPYGGGHLVALLLRLGFERVRGVNRVRKQRLRFRAGAFAYLLRVRENLGAFRLCPLQRLRRVLLCGAECVQNRLLARAIALHQLIHGVDARFQQRNALKTLFQEELHIPAFHSSTSSFSCCVSLWYPMCA